MQTVVLFIPQAKYWKKKIVEISTRKKIQHVKGNLCKVNICFLIRNHELHIQTIREKHPIMPATNRQWLLTKIWRDWNLNTSVGNWELCTFFESCLDRFWKVKHCLWFSHFTSSYPPQRIESYLHKNFYTYNRNNQNVQKEKFDHLSWINKHGIFIKRKSFSHKWMKYWYMT